MAVIRFYAAKPNSVICGMSLPVLFPRDLYLMKVAILWREQVIFFVLFARKSSVPNSEIDKKLPSQSCGSAG